LDITKVSGITLERNSHHRKIRSIVRAPFRNIQLLGIGTMLKIVERNHWFWRRIKGMDLRNNFYLNELLFLSFACSLLPGCVLWDNIELKFLDI